MPLPVLVAIPARDEARRLPDTLRALAGQRDAGPFAVLVLANGCRDASADVARRELARLGLPGGVIETADLGGVAAARGTALDRAAELAGPHGLLVCTDADTRPLRGWLRELLRPLQSGQAEVSAGRILLCPRELAALPAAVQATHRLDSAYRTARANLEARLDPLPFDPAPRHAQHFGASLAFSVAAYRAVGGVPRVAALEDVALVQAMTAAGLRLRHTPHARVHTSARRSGRVGVGLSSQLREWEGGPHRWRVPGGPEVSALARAGAALRRAHAAGPLNLDTPDLEALAARWRVPTAELRSALARPTAEAALQAAHAARQRAGHWESAHPPVPVERALAEVQALLREDYTRSKRSSR